MVKRLMMCAAAVMMLACGYGARAETATVHNGTCTYLVRDGGATLIGLRKTTKRSMSWVSAFSPVPTGRFGIPDMLDAYPVKSIGESAFYDCASLTNVVISSKTLTIEKEAFYGYDGLKSVTVPRGATVGKEAFPVGCEVRRKGWLF